MHVTHVENKMDTCSGSQMGPAKSISKNCWSDIHHVDVAHLPNSRLAIDYQECVAPAGHAGPADVRSAQQLTRGDMKIIASAAARLHIID